MPMNIIQTTGPIYGNVPTHQIIQQKDIEITIMNIHLSKVFLAAVLMAALVFPGLAVSAEKTPTITVAATGTMAIKPDMAIIVLAVQRQAKTARQALDQNNAAMAAVIREMKLSGIDDKDLQTSNFNIQPRFFYPKQNASGERKPARIVGYIVTNQLTVRIRNLDKLGAILDKSVDLGINSGGNIRFTNQDPKMVISQARQKAMANAIEKAETLAAAANVKLGKIMRISEQPRQISPRPIQEMALSRASVSSAVPIATGENTYKVIIEASWEIIQ